MPTRSSLPPNLPFPPLLCHQRRFKHLSRVDINERRLKGLCFKCEQLFYPQHHCPNDHLRVLLLNDDNEVVEHGNLIHNGDEENLGKTEEEGECQILYFLGLVNNTTLSPQTLKLRGELHGRESVTPQFYSAS